ncbi:MAG: carbohydrate kinase family protein [Methanobacterium sp.]|uniref:carbohydrate kinase family protein n=1 Tax=Methanobacterium sp. TaxID=2164 RepID=UPI003D65C892|nr:carbohydrate kinase family protein [Methanobacterium sp.]
MIKKTDLLAIGHTAFDSIVLVKEFPSPNSSTQIKQIKNFFGGAAANVTMVASNLGLKTSLVSAVGNDFKDSTYQSQLKNAGIDTKHMIVIEDEQTPLAWVFTDSNNDQISYFYWGAAAYFKKSEAPKKAIGKVNAVHLATGDPSFNRRSGEVAYEYGKLISFDPGQDLHMYSPEELKQVIGVSDILFGNHFEIDRIMKTLNVDINQLREIGPEIVVKTYGKDGSIIYADKKIKIDAVIRTPVDPTGAGDSYRAAFLSKYLNGEDIEYCAKFASAVSSFIVEAEGCQTNIPNHSMALERMREKWDI